LEGWEGWLEDLVGAEEPHYWCMRVRWRLRLSLIVCLRLRSSGLLQGGVKKKHEDVVRG
jgi:hypothetical protein